MWQKTGLKEGVARLLVLLVLTGWIAKNRFLSWKIEAPPQTEQCLHLSQEPAAVLPPNPLISASDLVEIIALTREYNSLQSTLESLGLEMLGKNTSFTLMLLALMWRHDNLTNHIHCDSGCVLSS